MFLKEGEQVKKYKIGYTTGVFDLFHIGHLNILKRAKEQCEYLIVGVSTDELVQIYKNKTPIIPYDERVKIVEAIKYVDKAVMQNTLDKILAWNDLKFDVLFQGNDWKDSKLYNYHVQMFEALGVKLVLFPYTQGTSSTLINTVLQEINKNKVTELKV